MKKTLLILVYTPLSLLAMYCPCDQTLDEILKNHRPDITLQDFSKFSIQEKREVLSGVLGIVSRKLGLNEVFVRYDPTGLAQASQNKLSVQMEMLLTIYGADPFYKRSIQLDASGTAVNYSAMMYIVDCDIEPAFYIILHLCPAIFEDKEKILGMIRDCAILTARGKVVSELKLLAEAL